MTNQYYTLITGASEGFGKSLAIECAKRKMNLILVALPNSKLFELVEYIRNKYNVPVTGIEKDLCKENSCLEIFDEVKFYGLQINMLFNNAGTGSTGLFTEGNALLFERQIKLNVLATTLLTRMFIEMLKKNSPSYILNVGSLASYFPLPKKQVYGATKSFIYYLTNCLRKELKKDNVYVSIVCPGPMNTNITVRSVTKNGNFLIRNSCMDPEKVAPIVLNGIFKKKEVIIPGTLNKCYVLLYTILPEFIKTAITNRSMKKLNSYNISALKFNSPIIIRSGKLANSNN